MVPSSDDDPQTHRVLPWLAWLPRSVLGVARSGSVIVVGLALKAESCPWPIGGDELKCAASPPLKAPSLPVPERERSPIMARRACCASPELDCPSDSDMGSRIPTVLRVRFKRDAVDEVRDDCQAEECEANDELLE